MKRSHRRRSVPVALLAIAGLALPTAVHATGSEPGTADLVDVVVPGEEHQIIGFSSEAGGWPTPEHVDGTADAVFTDIFDETWVIEHEDPADGGGPVHDPPHWLAFDVGHSRDLSSLQYGVKAGQGHIEHYNVYATNDDDAVQDPQNSPAWGEPITSGEFTEEHDTIHSATFDEVVSARYIKFEATTSYEVRGLVAASYVRMTERVPATVQLPDVIPAITGEFAAAEGSFELAAGARLLVGEGVPASTGEIFAEELEAALGAEVPIVTGEPAPGDVVLTLGGGADLGEEGYALDIGETLTVSAAEPVGVFYGTRTLAQMFSQRLELPAGQVNDVPAYAERGLTICACQINISEQWIDRVLDEMSYFKLNYALLELKMLSERYPETHTWGYYTREQVERFVTKANERGIDVIPEINAPGHMSVWLENKPELQLENRHGELDEMRFDISNPASFEFYTDLIDEYFEVFTSDYWHMGADEYMIYSDYDEFPQLGETARERWGARATPDDLYTDFINQVNAYVKDTHGKTLRIWNDGLVQRNQVVDLDSDIVVEHWWHSPSEPARPSQLLQDGHRIMNSSVELYLTRGGPQMNTEHLYNTRWHVGYFHDEALPARADGVTGAKVSLWPDHAEVDTENQVEASLFMPLRFIAQATWSDDYALPTYSEFRALADAIGRPLGWENIERRPVSDGTYTIITAGQQLTVDDEGHLIADADGASWRMTSTDDHYYRIHNARADVCLDVVEGQRRLGAPVEAGVAVAAEPCRETNMQKWQLIAHENGHEIVNAITQQRLSLDEGKAVQLPPDVSTDRWTLQREVDVHVHVPQERVEPGGRTTVEVTVANHTEEAISDVMIDADLPQGWALSEMVRMGDLAAGQSGSGQVELIAQCPDWGGVDVGIRTAWSTPAGQVSRSTAVPIHVGPLTPVTPVMHSVSSENWDGPGSNALNDDIESIWHTQWQPTEDPLPHFHAVDLGQEMTVFAYNYQPRAVGDRGRIADYEVYVSNDPNHWGDPVATGTFEPGPHQQQITFEATSGQYVKLQVLSVHGGHQFAAMAGMSLEAATASLPECPDPDPAEAAETLIDAVEEYVHTGAVAGPIAQQLANAAQQAQTHLEAERMQPAKVALQRFLRHVDNPKGPDTLTEEARVDLREQVSTLLDLLS